VTTNFKKTLNVFSRSYIAARSMIGYWTVFHRTNCCRFSLSIFSSRLN